MVEKTRYYCFRLTPAGEDIRVRADKAFRHPGGQNPYYELRLRGELVGEIPMENLPAWWVEETDA